MHSFHKKDQRLNAPVLQDVDLYKDYYKLIDSEKASAAISNMISVFSSANTEITAVSDNWESCVERGLAGCGGLHGFLSRVIRSLKTAQTTLMRF